VINRARFGLLLVPALVAAAALLLGSGTAVALPPASDGRQHFKLTVRSLIAQSALVTPGAVGNDDGERRTDLVVRLRRLAVRDLCASYRGGPYTLRITVPRFDADRLTVAVDSLDGLGVLGLALGTPRGGLPLTPASGTGFLPLRLGAAAINVDVTVRSLTGAGFRLDDLGLDAGRGQPECF
jgi:hypothetical protein